MSCSVQYSVLGIQKKFFIFKRPECLVVILLFAFANDSFSLEMQQEVKAPASSSFFERKAEGWHWYQNQESEIREQESGRKLTQTPTQAIEAQRKALETKLHAAVVDPTPENLMAYITAQKALMDQSQRFSEMWKQVVMTTPSLDETLQHPVDQNAQHIYSNSRSKNVNGSNFEKVYAMKLSLRALSRDIWVKSG